jgi:hypothetical protein
MLLHQHPDLIGKANRLANSNTQHHSHEGFYFYPSYRNSYGSRYHLIIPSTRRAEVEISTIIALIIKFGSPASVSTI